MYHNTCNRINREEIKECMTPKYEKEKKRKIIRREVLQFMSQGKMFTSVDIGNVIKSDGYNVTIRNRDVSVWLRRNFMRLSHDKNNFYNSTMITVDNVQKAYLYHPHNMSSDAYLDRDQTAKSPNF